MPSATLVGQNLEDTEQLDAMIKMAEAKITPSIPNVGDLVKGTVIGMFRNLVRLDIAGITSGVVRGTELQDESGEYSHLKLGDEVEATVLDMENENGEMELSFMHAGHQKAWEGLETLMNKGEIVIAKIVSANKGGLMCRVGHVMGFLPVSQLTTENYPRVDGGDKNKILEKLNLLVNKSLEVKIIDVNEEEEKLIVSEKSAWEEKKKDVLSKYIPGNIVEGKVSGVVDFGAFVEFGDGLEGLVHISELAWQRIENPRDIINIGDTVKAEIIGVDGSKISLSIKKLQEDPWKKAAKKYNINDTVKGTVLKINPFGLFVELDEHIHGLAHVTELSPEGTATPETVAKIGENREFKIISIEPEHHRLGLSINALTGIKSKKPANLKAEAKKPEELKAEAEEKAKSQKPQTEVEEEVKA